MAPSKTVIAVRIILPPATSLAQTDMAMGESAVFQVPRSTKPAVFSVPRGTIKQRRLQSSHHPHFDVSDGTKFLPGGAADYSSSREGSGLISFLHVCSPRIAFR